jgi:hypothetical protein
MLKRSPRLLVCAVLVSLAAAPALARKQELPEVTEDGLHRVENSRMAVVYAEPGADLSGYDRVQLLDAYVAFKKNWERNQRSRSADPLSVTSRDVEKIKKDLSQGFREVFEEVLDSSGYAVVDEAAEDVLLVRPAIINLDVNAPDTMVAGRSRTYTDSAGEMTLYVEIYDSVTGDLVAKAMDRRTDRNRDGFYTWTNSVTNRMAANRIMKGWAEILVDALNEARQTAGNVDDDDPAE